MASDSVTFDLQHSCFAWSLEKIIASSNKKQQKIKASSNKQQLGAYCEGKMDKAHHRRAYMISHYFHFHSLAVKKARRQCNTKSRATQGTAQHRRSGRQGGSATLKAGQRKEQHSTGGQKGKAAVQHGGQQEHLSWNQQRGSQPQFVPSTAIAGHLTFRKAHMRSKQCKQSTLRAFLCSWARLTASSPAAAVEDGRYKPRSR
eukprot:1157111-Pelagomonas_calceolata.AAC.10